MHPIISNISKFFNPTLQRSLQKRGMCTRRNMPCRTMQVRKVELHKRSGVHRCSMHIRYFQMAHNQVKIIVFIGKNCYIHTEYFISHISLCSLLQACTNDGGLKGNGTVHGTCNSGSKCMANGDCHGMGCYVFNANCSRTAAGIRNEILSLTFTVI